MVSTQELLESAQGLLESAESELGMEVSPYSEQDLKVRAYQLKVSGSTYTEISTTLGVSSDTARDWVLEITRAVRHRLESIPAADALVDNIVYFEHMESTFLASAAEILESGKAVNSSGQVVNRTRGSASRWDLYLKFLRAAMDARKQKIDLMQSCGILPKSTDQLYKDWKGKSEADIKQEEEKKERTADEIREDIKRLIANSDPLA
jgi:hypothetical protein